MSSGSESDDDYVPREPEKVSEEESADDETDLQFEKEREHKSNKRKSLQSSKGKKKKIKSSPKDVSTDSNDEIEERSVVLGDPEKEKKRQDDLWAQFLEGTDTKHKVPAKNENNTQPIVKDEEPQKEKNVKDTTADNKEREKRIFEFAGETIVVENNTIKEKIKTTESKDKVQKLDAPSGSRGGGLSNLLGQLNKKNQLSTLEKSKLDWNTYKKVEGIEEEIVNHNKGKSGYLDRRDFLDRTDVRQYELERDLRMSKRSNR